MKINNKEINTLKINNKLVKSIKRLSDNKIIYRGFDGLLLTERTGKTILSSADDDGAYFEVQLTKNGNPVSLKNIVVELYQDGEAIDGDITDSNGKVVFSYGAIGIGDTSFQAKADIFVSKTYSIQDCVKYIPTVSKSFGTAISFQHLYSLAESMDYILEAELVSNVNNRFGLVVKESDNQDTSNYSRLGVEGSNVAMVILDNGNNWSNALTDTYTVNTPLPLKIKYENGVLTGYKGDTQVYSHSISFNPLHIMLIGWNTNNKTVTVNNLKIKPLQSIDINVDNPILSFADSTQENPQTATLTATVSPVVQGKTVNIYKDGTLIATEQTNSQGQVSYEYTSQGIGDVEFRFECGLVSKRYSIEDCRWYDDASSDKSSSYTKYGSPTFNYSDGKYYIRKTGSGWGFVTPMNTPISTNDDISIEVDFVSVGMFLGIGLYKSSSTHLPFLYYNPSKVGMYGYGSTNNWIVAQESISTSAPLTMKFDLKNNVINLSVYDNNGVLVWSKSNITIPSTFNNSELYLTIGNPNHNSTDNYGYFKNVKIKPLQSIDISVDNPILSFADSTQENPQTATLTATISPAIQGKQVEIYQDDVLVATEQTDSQGQISYEYTSQGVGDVEFRFESGALTKTFNVCDAVLYDSTEYQSTVEKTLPVNLVNTNYQCDFDAIVDANCGFWVEIGQNVNNTYFFGCTGVDREIGIYAKVNGSNVQSTVSSGNVFANPSTPHFEYTCINNVHTLKCNGTTVSMTNSQITAKNYLKILARQTCNCKIKNIMIKPLPSIDISVDNTILSYADSTQENPQTATLTATVSPVVQGKTVKIYKENTLIATEQTDSQGQVSYEYTSQGIGDVEFRFECGLVSETYGVQDCRFFDGSSSENVSKYGSSSAFSYDSTEQAYYISTSSAKNITRDSVVGDFDFEISMDFKLANGNTNFYCGESTTGYECQGQVTGSSFTIKGVRTYYTDSSRSISGRQYYGNYTLTNSKWYTYKVTRVGNTLTAQILDGDTVIATATDNDVRGTSNNVSWHNYVVTGQMYWKNIKFKPL